MPDTATEQSGVAEMGQSDEFDMEHSGSVAGFDLAAASDGNEAVAESKSTFDPGLLDSDEGILKAAELYPNLKGLLEKQRKDGENIGRQRREAELRRDQGSVERAQAYHEHQIGRAHV